MALTNSEKEAVYKIAVAAQPHGSGGEWLTDVATALGYEEPVTDPADGSEEVE
jgi:hypothetical protein